MSREQRIAVYALFILSIGICFYSLFLGHRIIELENQNKILNYLIEKYEDSSLIK